MTCSRAACSNLSFAPSWPETPSSRLGPQTLMAVMCSTQSAPPTTWWQPSAGISVPGTAMCMTVQQKMCTWPLNGTDLRSGSKVGFLKLQVPAAVLSSMIAAAATTAHRLLCDGYWPQYINIYQRHSKSNVTGVISGICRSCCIVIASTAWV